MVAINYTLQVTEMGPMKPEHRTRKALAEGSCRSLELSLFDSSATVRDLKYSVVEHLGCPAVVEVWGPKIAEVGSDVGLCPYSSRCSELFYLLAGQLYKYAGPAWRGLGACVHLHPQLGVPPLADLSRLEGKTLLRVVAHKKPPQTAVFDSSKPQFDIQVKTLTGQWLPFKVCGSMLLEEFKEMMQDAEGIPPDMQRYIFRGIQLEDGYTLSYYGLDSTAAELAAQGQGQVPVLHLVLRLRGGMYHETSGRHDNESMSAEPLTHTEVTVAVPGFGELQLTVPVDVSGPQLLQLVQQRVQTDSAAAQAPVAVIDLVSTDEEDDADAEEASLQPQKTAAAAAAAEHDGRHSKRQRC